MSQASSELHAEIQRLTEEIKTLRFQAHHDELTGCLRRKPFFDLYEKRKAFGFYSGPCAVAVIDLDHFKKINDTYGHVAGDHVLQDFSRRLRAIMPEGALICRMGGEEFTILAATTSAALTERLQILLAELASSPVRFPCHRQHHYSFSAGVLDQPSHQPLTHTLIRADLLLYRAKNHGRNQIAA